MKTDYKTIIPKRFQEASLDDLSTEMRKAVLDQLKKKEGLYLYGGTGTGKTHIASAVAREAIEKGIEVMFYNTGEFLEKLRSGFDNPDDEDLFNDVMDFEGILVLDDIGSEKSTEWARERLYLIINKKYEQMVPVIFTSNCDLKTLSLVMGDRISSRIVEMAEVIHINSQDRRLTQKSHE